MQRHARPRCRRAAAHAARHAGGALLLIVSVTTAAWAATESPRGGRAAVPVDPAPRVRTHRVVFTCIEPGLVTFADKPCGPSSQVRDMAVEHERAPAAPSPAPRNDGSAGKAAARAADALVDARDDDVADAASAAEAQAQTCARLTRALRELDARMRAGYSAREAGRLWDRWREARQRVREAGC